MSSFFESIRRLGFRRGPQRILGGICGAIADRLGASLTVVRVLTLVLFLLPGIGFGLYLVVWLLLPWQDGTIPLERLFKG
ncbi:PspC domain-containing protein [Georgenia sp. MJ173]|uniref:PspC domain-containing protein n=1 Tax=Georgenia sunbinii TaxID=3117728 RepID=UPI002F2664E7